MLPDVSDFLSRKRLAIVGVSRNPKDFSRAIFRAFRDRGYDAVPVNPALADVDGAPCFARVQDIHPPVDAALLMTPLGLTGAITRDCVEAGVPRLWLYQRSPAAEALCAAHAVPVIAGECPLMFLPSVGLIHRIHRWFRARAKA